MILIDLNKYHFKVVNNGQVWTHGLDELQTIVVLDYQEMAIVRKGQEIAKMPLALVCKWMFPVGKADVDHCLNRRNPAGKMPKEAIVHLNSAPLLWCLQKT